MITSIQININLEQFMYDLFKVIFKNFQRLCISIKMVYLLNTVVDEPGKINCFLFMIIDVTSTELFCKMIL